MRIFSVGSLVGTTAAPTHTRLEVNFVMQAFPNSPLELHTVHAHQAVHFFDVLDITRSAVEIERRSSARRCLAISSARTAT